ncbi:hypothetical protein H4S06_003023 [Coemansia sp. BCRC 34490]|nr:hypothetical protein H4S06_003023 [Coemansia sp. BCRC 34490]
MPIAQTTHAAEHPTKTTPSGRVLESAEYISRCSRDVHVPDAGVRQAAQEIMRRMQRTGYSTADWKRHALNPSVADAEALEWIFVVDALNFSFWSANTLQPADESNDEEEEEQGDAGGTRSSRQRYTVTLDGTAYTGYWTLCAAVNRALREGTAMTDAAFYSRITEAEAAHVFRTDDAAAQEAIPLLGERVRVLREVGGVLREKYGGKFANLVGQCAGSAQRLVELVVRDFPCFRDEHWFAGRPVQLYKRAQILVADAWACFEGAGLGRFDDIDSITMFADYRVPQALCRFGALQYSDRLLDFLRASERSVRAAGSEQDSHRLTKACPPARPGLLPSGHAWEVEIRGSSVWAVELIRRRIAECGVGVNAVLIDFYLWDYAKDHPEEMQTIPIHLTRSVFY